MSFLSGLANTAKKAFNFFTGDSIGAQIARTAASGLALRAITRSIERDERREQERNNPERVDPGVRLQLDPDPLTSIPVLYGAAVLGGKIVDVALVNNGKNLYVAMTLSMRTFGTIEQVSVDPNAFPTYKFRRVFMDDQELLFRPAEVEGIGFLADKLRDAEGRFDSRVSGQIAMNFYGGDSSQATAPEGLTLNPSITDIQRDARNIFPNWTANHFMFEQVFVIVQVQYNPEAGLNRFPQFRFEVENPVTEPGDVLFDYLTSNIYGLDLPEGYIIKQ